MMKQLLALPLLVALTASVAHSATFTYDGDTTGAAQWFRPQNNSHPPSIRYDVNPSYNAFSFRVSASGVYNFISDATLPVVWDNYLILYDGVFDPQIPQVGFVILNDDFPTFRVSIGTSGFVGVALQSDSPYVLVTTGFSGSDFGQFSNTISGPGYVIPALVPAPKSIALIAIGFALFALRRVRVDCGVPKTS
jgi:hypothetical protein